MTDIITTQPQAPYDQLVVDLKALIEKGQRAHDATHADGQGIRIKVPEAPRSATGSSRRLLQVRHEAGGEPWKTRKRNWNKGRK